MRFVPRRRARGWPSPDGLCKFNPRYKIGTIDAGNNNSFELRQLSFARDEAHTAPHLLVTEMTLGENTNNWYLYKNERAMARNTSILLGNHFETFISDKIASGKYNSASEVIRTALRLLEDEEQKMKDLNKALAQGEKSGWVENFDPKENLKKLHKKFL